MSGKKLVFMFSGQGSHYFQMGRSLYDQDKVFRSHMLTMDGLLRDKYGMSIIDVLYNEAHRKGMVFDRTYWTNPAILMVELALSRSLMARGIEPDVLLGSSLGTFTAGVIAGSCSWEDALVGVIEQAKILEAYCPQGTMIAVMAPVWWFDELGWSRYGEMAGISYPSHFVVSSDAEGVSRIESDAKSRQLIYQRLQVSYAFHSSRIDPAKEVLLRQSQPLLMKPPSIPIMCCASAGILGDVIDPDYFWVVARKPIRFMEAFNILESTGPYQYIDVGPAGTLANFAKQNLPLNSLSQHHTVMTPFGSDVRNFEKLVTCVRSG